VTQSFSNNAPIPCFSNQSPGTLNDELRSAEDLGIRPIKVGEAGFDDLTLSGLKTRSILGSTKPLNQSTLQCFNQRWDSPQA
jgi:hypothetical protein